MLEASWNNHIKHCTLFCSDSVKYYDQAKTAGYCKNTDELPARQGSISRLSPADHYVRSRRETIPKSFRLICRQRFHTEKNGMIRLPLTTSYAKGVSDA